MLLWGCVCHTWAAALNATNWNSERSGKTQRALALTWTGSSVVPRQGWEMRSSSGMGAALVGHKGTGKGLEHKCGSG